LSGELLRAADLDLSDTDFDKNLEIYCDQIREMRQRWIKQAIHESMIFLPVEARQQ